MRTKSAPAFTPRLPRYGLAGLLLLGLLALLLWGQCGGTSGPNYELRVARVDSLAAPFAGAPPRLWPTARLRARCSSIMREPAGPDLLAY